MQRSLFVSHHAPTYLLLALWSSASMSTVYICHYGPVQSRYMIQHERDEVVVKITTRDYEDIFLH